MRRRDFPPINEEGAPDLSRIPAPSGAPVIERVDLAEVGPGDTLRLGGLSLPGSEILIGRRSARVLASEDRGVSVEVPELPPGDYAISVQNAFGYRKWSGTIKLLSRPNRMTFRGDAVGWHVAGGNSIVPKKLNQPVLVLICQAPDVGLPAGKSTTDVKNELQQKLDAATDSVNAFWKEATYGQTSFDFKLHPTIETLPNNIATYFQASRARSIDGAGAAFPVNWTGGETLTILCDEGTISVAFPKGPMTAMGVATTINSAVQAAAADATEPPMLASVAGGQIRLETAKQSASAVLDVTGGSARGPLGLAAAQITVTPGLNHVANRTGFMTDALGQFLTGKTDAQAEAEMKKYACVVCALAHNTTSALLRAYANSVMVYNISKTRQAKFSDVIITTGYPWTVFAHEFGHTLGLPDLYDESGKQAGIEPDKFDIMGPSHYNSETHPLAWAKHWRSRRSASSGEHVLNPWLADNNVCTIKAPDTGKTKSWEVILAPIESKLPAANPFATTYPSAEFKQAVRIEINKELSLYLENRQKPFSSATFGSSSFDSDLAAEGVVVTSAVDRDSIQLYRVFCVLETGPNDLLDTAGDTWAYYLTTTNRIQVSLKNVLGTAPPCYRVVVTWGDVPPATGTSLDLRIDDWKAPPWESPDIWVDTEVDNAWGEYTYSDAAKNPGVAGHPVRAGDRLKVGERARLYARVWNDGTIEKKGARVHFQIVKPAGMGPNPVLHIPDPVSVDVPAGGSVVAGPVEWTPKDDNDEHVCIRAFVEADPVETDHANNSAQENFSDWYVEKASPYSDIERPFQATNPLPRRAFVQMRANGLEPGFNLTVEPYEFWLEAGQTVHGKMTLETEDHVMLEDARAEEGQPPPLVSLEAWVLRHDTFVPFGGFTGAVHTVRRSELDLQVDLAGNALDVSGRAGTQDGPVDGGRVTLTVRNGEDGSVLAREHLTTYKAGTYDARVQLRRRRSWRRPGFLEVTASLSPGSGYGPVDAGPVRVAL